MFDKILISQCFLGEKVRYDGKQKRLNHPIIALWQQQKRFIAICPEISGGLSVPREPAEQVPLNSEVITQTGINVTTPFNQGALLALALCQKHNIRFALLKESSPSCGSTTIYDGSFKKQKIKGQGVTSRLLIQHGITVFSEYSLQALAQRLDK